MRGGAGRSRRRRRALWRSRVSRMTTMDARRKVAWTSRGAWVARGARRWARSPRDWTCEGTGGERGGQGGSVRGSRAERVGRDGRKRLGTRARSDGSNGSNGGRDAVDAGRSGTGHRRRGTLGDGARWEGKLAGRIVPPARARRRASLRREKSAVGPGDEGRGGIKDRGAVAHLTPSPRRPPPPSSSSSTLNASSLRNIVAIARLVE